MVALLVSWSNMRCHDLGVPCSVAVLFLAANARGVKLLRVLCTSDCVAHGAYAR